MNKRSNTRFTTTPLIKQLFLGLRPRSSTFVPIYSQKTLKPLNRVLTHLLSKSAARGLSLRRWTWVVDDAKFFLSIWACCLCEDGWDGMMMWHCVIQTIQFTLTLNIFIYFNRCLVLCVNWQLHQLLTLIVASGFLTLLSTLQQLLELLHIDKSDRVFYVFLRSTGNEIIYHINPRGGLISNHSSTFWLKTFFFIFLLSNRCWSVQEF